MKRCDACNAPLDVAESIGRRCGHCCWERLQVNWRRMRPEEKFVLAESAAAIVTTGRAR